MQTRATTLALLVGALGLYADAPVQSAQRPVLTGRWQLNASESEDARAKLRAEGPGERGGRGPHGGGRSGGFPGGRPGGGARPGGGPPGGRPGGPGGPAGPSEIHEFFQPAQSLTITGNDAELTLDDGAGGLTRLHLDGKPYKREGGALETRAEWKEQALVVESKSERGTKLTSTYRLLSQAGKLELVSRLEGRREPVVVRRVYDSVPAEASPAAVP